MPRLRFVFSLLLVIVATAGVVYASDQCQGEFELCELDAQEKWERCMARTGTLAGRNACYWARMDNIRECIWGAEECYGCQTCAQVGQADRP